MLVSPYLRAFFLKDQELEIYEQLFLAIFANTNLINNVPVRQKMF